MHKILLIDANSNLRDLLAVHLNMYVGVDVISRTSLAEALEVLKAVPEMDIIIARDQIALDNVAHELYRFLHGFPREIPMIVLGDQHNLKGAVKTIRSEGPALTKDVVSACAKILGITAKMMSQKIAPQYYPVDIQYFYHLDQAPCDVYMRINKGDGDYQYVKRIHQKEGIDVATLENYKLKGVAEFFVESSFRLEFSKMIASKIMATFENSHASPTEKMDALSSAQSLVSDELKLIGMTEHVVQLANASIKEMTKIVNLIPDLRLLINALLQAQGSYRYRHSQVITYLTFHVVTKMEWGSMEQADKLCFVAFFHDITLLTDGEAKIHSDEELKQLNSIREVVERINKHAYHASEFVKNYPGIPLGADAMIKQHHGTKNGVGFPQSPSPGISPLAIVFLVVEDFAKRLLVNPERPFDVKAAISKMEKVFTMPKYKKVLDCLVTTLGSTTI